MPSVLTPYRSSDGNNPYTEAQLKLLYKDLEPESREPGKYSIAEKLLLQRTFLTFIQEGWTATKAISRIKAMALNDPSKMPYADLGVFMAWKAYDADFRDAYEVAYAMGTDLLEDKGTDLAINGNASMLQFLLKMRNPQRYNPKVEHIVGGSATVDHVHTIKLVAAKPKPLEIEHDAGEAHEPVETHVEPAGIDAEGFRDV
jgi:hypothetical protein